MATPKNWRELLGQLTERPAERQRVADELGVTPYTISRWVSGESEPRAQNLKRLPEVFPDYSRLFNILLQADLEADKPAQNRPADYMQAIGEWLHEYADTDKSAPIRLALCHQALEGLLHEHADTDKSAPIRPALYHQALGGLLQKSGDTNKLLLESCVLALNSHAKPSTPDVSLTFLTDILSAYAKVRGPHRKWSLCSLTLQEAIKRLDPKQVGMGITIVQCVPPTLSKPVRTLYSRMRISTASWNNVLEMGLQFIGSGSLSSWAISRGEPTIVQDLKQWSNPTHKEKPKSLGQSAVAWPIQREGKIAGCLLVSSTQENYFTTHVLSTIEIYANVLALAFNSEEFYDLERMVLREVPELSKDQEERDFSRFRELVEDMKYIQGGNLLNAETLALQQMEAELLDDAGERESKTEQQASNTSLAAIVRNTMKAELLDDAGEQEREPKAPLAPSQSYEQAQNRVEERGEDLSRSMEEKRARQQAIEEYHAPQQAIEVALQQIIEEERARQQAIEEERARQQIIEEEKQSRWPRTSSRIQEARQRAQPLQEKEQRLLQQKDVKSLKDSKEQERDSQKSSSELPTTGPIEPPTE